MGTLSEAVQGGLSLDVLALSQRLVRFNSCQVNKNKV